MTNKIKVYFFEVFFILVQSWKDDTGPRFHLTSCSAVNGLFLRSSHDPLAMTLITVMLHAAE